MLNESGRAILQLLEFFTPRIGWLKLKGEERIKNVYCLVTVINVGCQSNILGQEFYFEFLDSGCQIPFLVSNSRFLTYSLISPKFFYFFSDHVFIF